MNRFYLRDGDTQPAFSATLSWAGGPTDLTNATASLLLRKSGDVGDAASLPLAVVLPRTVTRQWLPADITEAGDYEAVVKVTFSDGTVLTVPNRGHIPITVTPEFT